GDAPRRPDGPTPRGVRRASQTAFLRRAWERALPLVVSTLTSRSGGLRRGVSLIRTRRPDRARKTRPAGRPIRSTRFNDFVRGRNLRPIIRDPLPIGECGPGRVALARKLDALEKKCDAQFRVGFDAIRQLMAPPTPEQKNRRIGFRSPSEPDES